MNEIWCQVGLGLNYEGERDFKEDPKISALRDLVAWSCYYLRWNRVDGKNVI